MINLAIDIGNSRTKVAFFENSALLGTHSWENAGPEELERLLEKYRPGKAILASVTEPDPRLIACLEQHTDLRHFPGDLPLPVKNNYRTPRTLGADRLAAAIGTGSYGEDSDRLVIIAGTCITYNFVNRRNEFIGGAISPGLHMRFEAMHTFTGQLPLITLDKEFEGFLGRDTRESILAGVQAGSLAEAGQMISSYEEHYPGLRVFLCGGDAGFFGKRLKNSIFADRIVLDRELILKGLDRVLNYQYK